VSIIHFQSATPGGFGYEIVAGVTGATTGYVFDSIGSINQRRYKAGLVFAITTGSVALAFRVDGAGDQGQGYLANLSVPGLDNFLAGADANYDYSATFDRMSWQWNTSAGWNGNLFVNGQTYTIGAS